MRFLIDESADARLASYLTSPGHDAVLVAQHARPGLVDGEVLALANSERRISVTDDRDFGALVFNQHHSHAGVIDLRLGTTRLATRFNRLAPILAEFANELEQFIVVTDSAIRIRGAGKRHAQRKIGCGTAPHAGPCR